MCKRWNALTKSPVLWKIVDVELYESTSEAVKTFVQTLPSCVSSIKLNFMDMEYWEGDYWQHQKLDFEELCVMIQEKCPHLQLLNMWNALFSNNLQSITDLCTRFLPNVRRLVFYHCGFMEWSARMSNSGVSKIEALDVVKCYFELFDFPPLSKIPCLRELNLHGTVVNELLFENDIPFLNQLKVLNLGFTGIEYLRTFKTILSHAVNLEELYLCDINLYINDLNLNNLALPHLKTICLRSRWDVACDDIISLIQSCQSLENVYVDDDVAESYAKDPFVVNNRCKLEIVKANNIRDCHPKNRLCKCFIPG